jgi:hypothetical protein
LGKFSQKFSNLSIVHLAGHGFETAQRQSHHGSQNGSQTGEKIEQLYDIVDF